MSLSKPEISDEQVTRILKGLFEREASSPSSVSQSLVKLIAPFIEEHLAKEPFDALVAQKVSHHSSKAIQAGFTANKAALVAELQPTVKLACDEAAKSASEDASKNLKLVFEQMLDSNTKVIASLTGSTPPANRAQAADGSPGPSKFQVENSDDTKKVRERNHYKKAFESYLRMGSCGLLAASFKVKVYDAASMISPRPFIEIDLTVLATSLIHNYTEPNLPTADVNLIIRVQALLDKRLPKCNSYTLEQTALIRFIGFVRGKLDTASYVEIQAILDADTSYTSPCWKNVIVEFFYDLIALFCTHNIVVKSLGFSYGAVAALQSDAWQSIYDTVRGFMAFYAHAKQKDVDNYEVPLPQSFRLNLYSKVNTTMKAAGASLAASSGSSSRNPIVLGGNQGDNKVSGGRRQRSRTPPPRVTATTPPSAKKEPTINQARLLKPPKMPLSEEFKKKIQEKRKKSNNGKFCDACFVRGQRPFDHFLNRCPFFQQQPPFENL